MAAVAEVGVGRDGIASELWMNLEGSGSRVARFDTLPPPCSPTARSWVMPVCAIDSLRRIGRAGLLTRSSESLANGCFAQGVTRVDPDYRLDQEHNSRLVIW